MEQAQQIRSLEDQVRMIWPQKSKSPNLKVVNNEEPEPDDSPSGRGWFRRPVFFLAGLALAAVAAFYFSDSLSEAKRSMKARLCRSVAEHLPDEYLHVTRVMPTTSTTTTSTTSTTTVPPSTTTVPPDVRQLPDAFHQKTSLPGCCLKNQYGHPERYRNSSYTEKIEFDGIDFSKIEIETIYRHFFEGTRNWSNDLHYGGALYYNESDETRFNDAYALQQYKLRVSTPEGSSADILSNTAHGFSNETSKIVEWWGNRYLVKVAVESAPKKVYGTDTFPTTLDIQIKRMEKERTSWTSR